MPPLYLYSLGKKLLDTLEILLNSNDFLMHVPQMQFAFHKTG